MKKVEVLCTTMYQFDFSKYKEMNIQSDVVFANQADKYAFEDVEIDGHRVRMVTTLQRGVGRNRNTALLYAEGDICLFSDDDVFYVDGYVKKITEAFNEVSKADVLIFNLTSQSHRKQKLNSTIKRCRIWNVFSYGTVRIAFRLNKIQKKNIWFTQLFGGGCKYPSGEDSIWLLEALQKGLKIYTYPLKIGELKQEDSTWFKGYNEEYFFGRGALMQALMPRLKYIMFLYYIFRFQNISEITKLSLFASLLAGAKCYIQGINYSEWKEQRRY